MARLLEQSFTALRELETQVAAETDLSRMLEIIVEVKEKVEAALLSRVLLNCKKDPVIWKVDHMVREISERAREEPRRGLDMNKRARAFYFRKIQALLTRANYNIAPSIAEDVNKVIVAIVLAIVEKYSLTLGARPGERGASSGGERVPFRKEIFLKSIEDVFPKGTKFFRRIDGANCVGDSRKFDILLDLVVLEPQFDGRFRLVLERIKKVGDQGEAELQTALHEAGVPFRILDPSEVAIIQDLKAGKHSFQGKNEFGTDSLQFPLKFFVDSREGFLEIFDALGYRKVGDILNIYLDPEDLGRGLILRLDRDFRTHIYVEFVRRQTREAGRGQPRMPVREQRIPGGFFTPPDVEQEVILPAANEVAVFAGVQRAEKFLAALNAKLVEAGVPLDKSLSVEEVRDAFDYLPKRRDKVPLYPLRKGKRAGAAVAARARKVKKRPWIEIFDHPLFT